jgi:hypothetical protein
VENLLETGFCWIGVFSNFNFRRAVAKIFTLSKRKMQQRFICEASFSADGEVSQLTCSAIPERFEATAGQTFDCQQLIRCFNAYYGSDYRTGQPRIPVTFSIDYPGYRADPPAPPQKDPNIASYVNLHIYSSPPPPGLYNGWCFDVYDFINPGQTYNGLLVSLLDPHAADIIVNEYNTCTQDHPLYTTYLQSLLYVFNNVERYESSPLNYSSNDIQVAIWTLLFTPSSLPDNPIDPINVPLITDGLGINPDNVRAIIADAAGAQYLWNADHDTCARLITNNIGGLLLLPTDSMGQCTQIMTIMIELSCACPLPPA